MAASKNQERAEDFTLEIEHEAVLDHDHREKVIKRLLLTAASRLEACTASGSSTSTGSADAEQAVN